MVSSYALRSFTYIALLCLYSVSLQAKPVLISSIKPVQLLVEVIAGGHADVRLLLPANVSPHLYHLRPSDRVLLNNADRVFWVGPELERFLEKPLSLLEVDRVVTLVDVGGHEERLPRKAEPHAGDEHHEHTEDPHLWLNPLNAIEIADRIAQELIEIDSLHRDVYQQNLALLKQRLQALDQELVADFVDLPTSNYIVLHDAYGHFERRYGFRREAAFSLTPDRKPGARHLLAIRELLSSGRVRCLFREPQYRPAVLDVLVGDAEIRVGLLDPLAFQADSYEAFIRQFAEEFKRCITH